MGNRFPTPLAIDPWWDLYLPARCGEAPPVLEAVEAALRSGGPPDLLAVAVRALAALGRLREARALHLDLAGADSAELDRLDVLLGAHPDRALVRLQRRHLPPGLLADACCDRSARALIEGDLGRARALVGEVCNRPQDHAEAGRWSRFLAASPDPVGAYRAAVAGRALGADPAGRDAVALAISAERGWVSEVRMQRRLLAAPSFAPRAGSALARLADAGVPGGVFADVPHLGRVPASSPLVPLESLADLVASLVEEGRDARSLAEGLARQASLHGPEADLAAARLLVRLAGRDDRLLAVGYASARRLCAAGNGDGPRWAAWAALLGRTVAPDRSVEEARRLAQDPALDPETWLLALEALRACGHAGEARELALASRTRLDRAAVAGLVLGRRSEDPPLRGLPWASTPAGHRR